ncbi:hypothetical protein [Planktothrix phage Pra-JY27]
MVRHGRGRWGEAVVPDLLIALIDLLIQLLLGSV